jgi:hypothetical protein
VKTVLDEGVPEDIVEPLRRLGADVAPFWPEWRGFKNGVLLEAIEQAGRQLLLTTDKNMGFQLNLQRLRIAIVALPITRPDVLTSRAADIFDTICNAKAGEVIWIGVDGRRVGRSAGPQGTLVTRELARLPAFRL